MADPTDDLLGQVTAALDADGITVHLPGLSVRSTHRPPELHDDGWHIALAAKFHLPLPRTTTERHRP